MKRLILLLSLVLTGSQIFPQFSLDGEIRPRSEYRHGFQSLIGPDDDPAFFISQRTRLNFGYLSSDVNVYVSFQDIRVWGDVPQLNRSDMNSSIHQAWAEIPLFDQMSLKLGRQEVIYDNSRMFGNVDWAQQARSHDMALMKWKLADAWQLHTGLAFNQENEARINTFYGLPNYKTMQYGWLNYRPGTTSLSLLFLNLGFQQATDKTVFNQTMGGYISTPLNDLTLNGSVYLQTGKDVANRDLSAFYIGGEGVYALSDQWKMSVGFEWLSGTDREDILFQEQYHNRSFTPWFGTNHRFNGHMDYFYVGNHLNNVGLRNPYLVFDHNRNGVLFSAAIHGFWADGEITDLENPTQIMNSFLGTELDFIIGWNLNPGVSFRLGYSHMFATETMEIIKGGSKDEIQNWIWAMIIIKPKFI